MVWGDSKGGIGGRRLRPVVADGLYKPGRGSDLAKHGEPPSDKTETGRSGAVRRGLSEAEPVSLH